MEDVTQVLSAIASVAAVVIAYISYRAYKFLLPSAELKRKKDEAMNQIAGLLLEFHDQQKTIASALVNNFHLDPYVLSSRGRNSRHLYRLLDKAIKLGLWQEITGNHDLSITLYTAFRQSLASLADLDPITADPNDYLPQHVVMGTIRLADQCRKYEGLDLAGEVESVFSSMLTHQSLEEAWDYLKS